MYTPSNNKPFLVNSSQALSRKFKHSFNLRDTKMLGAIAASILGLKKWAPNYDRLVTETEWQGGPAASWIPLRKPITAVYEDYSVGNEIFLFIMATAIAIWAWRNRNNKEEVIFARIVLGLSLAAAVYFPLLWTARNHVEGDWTAVPPAIAAQLAPGGRIAAVLRQSGVGRGYAGPLTAAGRPAGLPFIEMAAPDLPGFAQPREFAF
jgi:hypothetical protein